MKSIIRLFAFSALLAIMSCKKDKNNSKELTSNTWSFKIDGPKAGTTIFTLKDMELTTNINGLIRVRSASGTGGNGADACNFELYFKSIPLVSKVYKVTELSRVSKYDDEVALFVTVSGDPSLTGGSFGSYWSSVGDGSQTIDYKFVNGKASFNFENINVYNKSNAAIQNAYFSANIIQP